MIRLDTHAVVWLFTGELERFTKKGRAAIDTQQLVVSPIVQLELTHLHEIGRLTVGGADILGDLASRIGLSTSDQSMLSVVQAAAGLTWTQDPFDRLIVADALSANCPLLTKDEGRSDSQTRVHRPLVTGAEEPAENHAGGQSASAGGSAEPFRGRSGHGNSLRPLP